MLRPTGRTAVTIDASSTRYLVVADLHVGYELELSSKGIRVPPHEERVARELVRLGEETGSQVLVLLGDVKHRVAGYSWRHLGAAGRAREDRGQQGHQNRRLLADARSHLAASRLPLCEDHRDRPHPSHAEGQVRGRNREDPRPHPD
jgi:hypothetical protein